MSKILKLTVNKTWFDMFKSGIKTEELRELKPYWVNRLCKKYPISVVAGGDFMDKHTGQQFDFLKFDLVQITNGYSKTSPQLTFEFKGTRIGNDYNMSTGGVIMADEEGCKKYCFIISVGSEVSRRNC